MKQFYTLLLACIFTFISESNAETITLRADYWCPYNCKENSKNPGYMVEIAETIFKKHGHEVDYKTLPWSTAITETREGKFDGIIGAFKGDAEDFIFPENALGLSTNSFFTLKENPWHFNGKESLENIGIGLALDYDYGKTLTHMLKQHNNVHYTVGEDPLQLNILKLIKGRISVLVEDKNVFLLKSKKMGIANKMRHAGDGPEKSEVYIAFSPSKETSKKYAKMLSDGIIELRKNGELQEILAKYNLTDWQE